MEILAPAGNFDALKAAVYSGADAVYLGVGSLNARAKADNFTNELLVSAVRFAHLYGVRVYLTLNTLLKSSEYSEALLTARTAAEAGVDAVIVQDLVLAKRLKERFPELPLHASTQLGIHNAEGAEAAARLGFSRVILARETLLDDIRKIRARVPNLEIECFVHGALCVAFSGNCYFSSLVSGYSGNRGRCMQLCRKKYRLTGDGREREGYYLSPKDLCLADRVADLESAGVCSLKIEGRLRSLSYVAETVRAYRKALVTKLSDADRTRLKTVFNRGDFCEGYLREGDGQVVYPLVQNHIGCKIGTVRSVDGGIARLALTRPLQVGDGVKYLHDGRETASGLITADTGVTGFLGRLKAGDEVRLTSSRALEAEAAALARPLGVRVRLELRIGKAPRLTLICGKTEVSVLGEGAAEAAQNNPLSAAECGIVLNKFGNTVFKPESVVCNCENDCFYPVSRLNALRRSAVLRLEEAMLSEYADANKPSVIGGSTSRITLYPWLELPKKANLFLQVSSAEQLSDALLREADYVVLNPAEFDAETLGRFREAAGEKAVLNLPVIARGQDLQILREAVQGSGIGILMVQNLYGCALFPDRRLIAGFGMNLLTDGLEIPYVQSIEAERFSPGPRRILYSYGYLPLMTFCHCPKKLNGAHCTGCEGYDDYRLKDEKGHTFRYRRIRLAHCYAQLMNEVPTDLIGESDRGTAENLLLDFSVCSREETEDAMRRLSGDPGFGAAHTHGNFGKKLF